MKVRSMALTLLTLSAVGCASDPPPKPPEPKQEQLTSIHVVKHAGYQTTDSRPTALAGAGFNQGAYIHVLHTPQFNAGTDKAPASGQEAVKTVETTADRRLVENTTEPVGVPARQVEPQPVVDAIRRAWQRYCNAGEGMTEEDWAIVDEQLIPKEFRDGCIPPK